MSVYRDLPVGNPRVVAMLNHGWWLGGAGERNPFVDLPQTVQAQQNIGNAVVNPH
jgi:hypothetical protein